MTTNHLLMLGLLTIGAIGGRLARRLPLNGWAGIGLAILPLGGIPLAMAFC